MEILISNPADLLPPGRPDQPPEASLASSVERLARSVDSELQSLVIEPRKFIDWWSLRVSNSGDHACALKESHCGDWSGANVRPGSESMAEQHQGLPGRWESLTFPWDISTGTGDTGLPTSLLPAWILTRAAAKPSGSTKVPPCEGDRARGKNEGSLSLCIVALEKRGTRRRRTRGVAKAEVGSWKSERELRTNTAS